MMGKTVLIGENLDGVMRILSTYEEALEYLERHVIDSGQIVTGIDTAISLTDDHDLLWIWPVKRQEDEVHHYNMFKKHSFKEVKKRNSFFRRKK